MYLSQLWAWSLCQLPELCDCGTVEGIGLDNSFKLQSLIQLHPVEMELVLVVVKRVQRRRPSKRKLSMR
jgi:hypothetical protein